MIHILTISHCGTLYGAGRSLLALVESTRASDVQWTVVLPGGDHELARALARLGVPVIEGSVTRWYSRARSPRRTVSHMRAWTSDAVRLSRIVQPLGVDIVHTNASSTPVGYLLARLLKVPHIWHLREVPHLHYAQAPDLGGHLTRCAFRSSYTVSVSKFVHDEMVGGPISVRHSVIYDGVALASQMDAWYPSTDGDQGSHEARSFVVMGVFGEAKRHDEAITALSRIHQRHPNWSLQMYGDASNRYGEQCRALVREYGLQEHVAMRGYVADPFAALRRADVFLMCSRAEGMGRVTAEAMAVGCPVIGYNSGGTRELVEDGATGLLYSDGPKGLAECMESILADRTRFAQMRQRSWHRARCMFTFEAYASAFIDVLGSACRQRADAGQLPNA